MSGLLLLDSASAYFRAFHGIPTTITAPDGRPVNAVRGLLDVLAQLVTTYRPVELVCCWDDAWRPDWRVGLVPSYKAHRVAADGGEDAPDELSPQVPVIRELLDAVGLPIVGAVDHEADDVIATLARVGVGRGLPVLVVTGDRDLFQLIRDPAGGRPGVRVLYTGRGMARAEVLDDAAVRARHGVPAASYAELATMRGDTSDGLPGVSGIGEKTAVTLLERHSSLAGIVEAAANGSLAASARVRAALLEAAPRLPDMYAVVRTADDLDTRGLLRPPAPPDGWPLPRRPADPDRFAALVAANGLESSARRLLDALAG
jgi:5'-3' exonuclease